MTESMFNHLILDKALMKAEEMMDRCLLKIVALDETADSIYHGKDLYGDGITICIREKEDTSPFKTALQYSVGETHPERIEKTDYGYKVKFSVQDKNTEYVDVPIKIKVIKRNYKFLSPSSLDARLYGYEYYYVPNPFKDYWKIRQLVR